MTLPVAVLVAGLLVQAGGVPAQAPRSGLSRDLSDAMGKKLELLEKFDRDPKAKRRPVDISESELNSYVRFALADRIPRGLRDVRILLRENRLELRGVANLAEFDELKEKAGASFLSLLGGEVLVEIVADFKSDRGFGQFEVQSAQVGPVPLSAALLGEIVSRATVGAQHPNGFDIRAPFRLPYSVKRIRPLMALATVEY